MSRFCLKIWICLLLANVTNAQLVEKPLTHITKQGASKNTQQAPLALPFWDDFSTSSGVPSSSLWAHGIDIFINNTLARNAPSINVATFDGATFSGGAHSGTADSRGAADSLLSHPIDLASVANRSSVILTFFWQVQGNGEIPEASDSLRLQFYASDSTWQTVWSVTGGMPESSDNFQLAEVPVFDPLFFHSGFRMKFQSFNSLSGIFDTWHIDYVYLNENRTNVRFLDRTISHGPGPLFGDFYQVPLHLFTLDPQLAQQSVIVNNLDNTVHPLDYTYTLTNLSSGQILLQEQLIGPILSPNENRLVSGAALDLLDLSSLEGDSIVIQSEFYYKTGDRNLFEQVTPAGDTLFLDVDLKVNDTIRSNSLLHEAYAYDDGTAEFAAGLNLDQGQLAIQFHTPVADTLSHIAVYFPSLSTNNSQPLDLIVWRRLEDSGEQTRQSFTISETQLRDEFTEVALFPPVIVSDTFYIGYQQFTDDYIGIGLDRSNDIASDRIFVNTDRIWQRNQLLSGALMIRPIFRPTDAIILSASHERDDLSIYPNPANDVVNINGFYQHGQLLNLAGQVLLNFSGRTVPLNKYVDGVYLLRLTQNKTQYIKKLIINRNGN